MKRAALRHAARSLALLLALSAPALAEDSILSRLYPDQAPPPAVAAAIVKDPASASAGGITLTLDEYLCADRTLNLGWTVQSARDETVYYLIDYQSDLDDLVPPAASIAASGGGTTIGSGSSSGSGGGGGSGTAAAGRYGLSSAGGSGDSTAPSSARGGLFAVLDGADGKLGLGRARSDSLREYRSDAIDQPFRATLTILAYTSPLEPVLAPEDAGPHWEDGAVYAELARERKLGIWSRVTGLGAYEEARQLKSQAQSSGGHPDYAQTGLMDPVATLSVTVTLDPGAIPDFWHTAPAVTSVEYAGGRIEIDELDFGAVASRAQLRVYPDGGIGSAIHHRFAEFVDEQDQPLFDSHGSTYADGDDHFTLTAESNPQPAPPTQVYLLIASTAERIPIALTATAK